MLSSALPRSSATPVFTLIRGGRDWDALPDLTDALELDLDLADEPTITFGRLALVEPETVRIDALRDLSDEETVKMDTAEIEALLAELDDERAVVAAAMPAQPDEGAWGRVTSWLWQTWTHLVAAA